MRDGHYAGGMRRGLAAVVLAGGLLALPTRANAADLGVTFERPVEGAVVAGSVETRVTTIGPVTSVAFEASWDAGATWIALGTDIDPVDGWTAMWETAGSSGPASLRATATDGTASVAAVVGVVVDNQPPTPTLELTRRVFSPNGDGREDATRIVLTLPEPASVSMSIADDEGRGVRRFLIEELLSGGVTALAWDGTGGRGRLQPDGSYVLTVTAIDAAGNTAETRAVLLLDTKAPAFRWLAVTPEPYLGADIVTFAFRAADRSSTLSAALIIQDAMGRRVVRREPRAIESGGAHVPWNGRDADGDLVPPGLYRATLVVTDDAGNRSVSDPIPFRDLRPVTTRVVRRVDGAGSRVALTFDDCVDGDAWSRILDVLAARGAGASFFCPGTRVNANPALAARTVAEGHTIGAHGWDHRDLTTLTDEEIRARLELDGAAWWRQASTTPVPYLRPPYGAYDADTLRVAGAEGYAYTILWDVDPQDWTRPGARAIAARVLEHARSGSIVVMHVLDQTAAALPAILDGLAGRGLRPVTLADLLAEGTPAS
jgi:peptidoglycan/xylan/chitin deacetylase (PgdA/CDA1 family)